MTKKQEIIDNLKASGLVVVIHTDQPGDSIEVARALAKGRVCFLEITMMVKKALSLIEQAVDVFKNEVVIISSSVLDAETAREAILAGASSRKEVLAFMAGDSSGGIQR